MLKSLSLCNKVLSYLVYSKSDNTNARHMALALVLTLKLLFRPHLHRQTFHYISGTRQIHAGMRPINFTNFIFRLVPLFRVFAIMNEFWFVVYLFNSKYGNKREQQPQFYYFHKPDTARASNIVQEHPVTKAHWFYFFSVYQIFTAISFNKYN